MIDRSQTFIIAKREFLVRARSRVFLFTLVGIAALIIGGMFLVGLLTGESEATRLGVGGDSPSGIVQDIEQAADALAVDVEVIVYATADEARAAVESGDVEAALVDGSVIVVNREVSRSTQAILTSAANAGVRRDAAAQVGITEEQLSMLLMPVPVTVEQLDPEDSAEGARIVASFFGALVLLTTIMMFGQFVAMGIVEEKQNRVVEVVLARTRTTSLLIGKVLGIGLLGLVQVVSIALAVVIGLAIAPLPEDLGIPDLASIGMSAAMWLVFWFVLGYLVYSFLYAALGATISRQEDMQSVAFIPAIGVFPAYFAVSATAASGETSTLVQIASYVPLWSPILMPFRISWEDAAAWEVALAIVLAILTIIALVLVSSRIYRGAALRTGAKISLREAWNSSQG
ncbi:MAG: ABC transporter permease [Acidimicrobiia bacterium]